MVNIKERDSIWESAINTISLFGYHVIIRIIDYLEKIHSTLL